MPLRSAQHRKRRKTFHDENCVVQHEVNNVTRPHSLQCFMFIYILAVVLIVGKWSQRLVSWRVDLLRSSIPVPLWPCPWANDTASWCYRGAVAVISVADDEHFLLKGRKCLCISNLCISNWALSVYEVGLGTRSGFFPWPNDFHDVLFC